MHNSRWKSLSSNEIIHMFGHKEMKKCKGLFYHKGGAGIESNPLCLRKPRLYLDGEKGRKGIFREKSKLEASKKWGE